jgi:ADP-ribose pyrophosphatase
MLRLAMNDRDVHLNWKEIHSRLVKRCGIFDLYESKRRAADGRQGIFHLLEAPGWVDVVPVLPDAQGRSCFLMVKQYRQGISRITVEFPAGLIEAAESPEAAAARELFEETGYLSKSLKSIGTIYPNPAFMTNRCYTFLAEGLHRETSGQGSAQGSVDGKGRLDELELLDALLVPIDEVEAEIGRGPFCNSMTALALYWYQRLNWETGADRIRTGA